MCSDSKMAKISGGGQEGGITLHIKGRQLTRIPPGHLLDKAFQARPNGVIGCRLRKQWGLTAVSKRVKLQQNLQFWLSVTCSLKYSVRSVRLKQH